MYSGTMPWGLKRFHQTGHLHFITFSCYHRAPYLIDPGAQRLFEQAVEQARVRYEFYVAGYVIMPEHVHLLMSEPQRGTLATAIQAIKQSVARRLIGDKAHFWHTRYYDFNVWSDAKRIEKLRVHAPQSCQARPVCQARRLAGEQLPALRCGRNGNHPNRIRVDGAQA